MLAFQRSSETFAFPAFGNNQSLVEVLGVLDELLELILAEQRVEVEFAVVEEVVLEFPVSEDMTFLVSELALTLFCHKSSIRLLNASVVYLPFYV